MPISSRRIFATWIRHPQLSLLILTALLLHFSSAAFADAPDGVSFSQATLDPGTETKIIDPLTGGAGYWLIYVPSDYSPARRWPVIFGYHGLNVPPITSPFRTATDGKGYIIVGMEYEDTTVRVPEVKKNLANLKRIHDLISKRLQLDEKLQFIGGGSQGGFRSSDYSEASQNTWAGVIILDAGRGVDALARTDKPNFNGKPIFIGDGETDANLPLAKQAASYYTQHGADVTLEIFPGLGHAVDENNAKFKAWLKEHGPLVAVKAAMAAAISAEKSGNLGQAYVLYRSVADNPDADTDTDKAKASAQSISDGAQKVLDDAEADLSAKKYSEAFMSLAAGKTKYAGCEWGDKINARYEQLQKDPDIHGQMEQARIDTAADKAEAEAMAAETAHNYKQAINDYQAYVNSYPKSHRIDQVRDHLAELQADKKIQAAITAKQADSDCQSWLSMAQNYIDSGSPQSARPYLQRVIDKYPNTKYADTAKKELDSIR
jgi:predicted esterase/outer membrane protein assembly factor BamD (BamD/ComL family)